MSAVARRLLYANCRFSVAIPAALRRWPRNDHAMTPPRTLSQARKYVQLTQRELARRACISERTLRALETPESSLVPHAETLRLLGVAVDLPPETVADLIAAERGDAAATRVTCAACGLVYRCDHPVDADDHRVRHRRRLRAYSALSYVPSGYAEQECLKAEGWPPVMSADPSDVVRGAEMVVRAGFDASLAAAIDQGYGRGHPIFAAYVAMRDLAEMPERVRLALRAANGEKPGPAGIRG